MYFSSVQNFISSLAPYDKPDTYIGMLESSNHIHKFIFNNHIKDILKSYNNYYILIYHIDNYIANYQKLYDYIDIDISNCLFCPRLYRCVLISDEQYMLYKLTHT